MQQHEAALNCNIYIHVLTYVTTTIFRSSQRRSSSPSTSTTAAERSEEIGEDQCEQGEQAAAAGKRKKNRQIKKLCSVDSLHACRLAVLGSWQQQQQNLISVGYIILSLRNLISVDYYIIIAVVVTLPCVQQATTTRTTRAN